MTLSSVLQGFHFLRPLWLLALPLLWAAVVWLSRQRSRDGNWAGLIDADLLPSLQLDGAVAAQRTSPWRWLALAWSVATLALAGPSWQRDSTPAYRSSAAWILVLDLSPSMTARDLKPNRVTRARYALDDLLGSARDTRVGLIVFSAEPYTVSPLTDDVATVRALLPPLEPDIMPSVGDELAPALIQAGKLLEQAGARDKRVIVLTDGFKDPVAAFKAAQQLHEQGVQLSVVGIGTSLGAPVARADGGFVAGTDGQTQLAKLDEDTLQQLASSGGGRYVDLNQLATLSNTLQADSAAEPGETGTAKNVQLSRWRDGGVWLLPALLLLAAPLARRGWL